MATADNSTPAYLAGNDNSNGPSTALGLGGVDPSDMGWYPAGVTANTQYSNNTNTMGTGSPDIDFISRAVNGLNSATSNGFSVFNFHNTLTDALQNGSLQNMNLQSGSSLLSSLPSDWKTKYSQDPESLGNLLENINNLVSIAHSSWSAPDKLGTVQSGWGGMWSNEGLNPYQNHINNSIQSNAGTEKDGYANHPDYSGKSGSSQMDMAEVKLGELAGLWGTATGAYAAGTAGIATLTGEGAAATAGEGILSTVGGYVGETGLLVGEESLLAGAGEGVAVGLGMASGVGELAVAAVGVAVVGYGLYKFLGGSGSVPFLDNVGSKMESAFNFFH